VILDTSALVSILRADDDAGDMALANEKADVRRISAVNFVWTTCEN